MPANGGTPVLVAALSQACVPSETNVGERGRKAVCLVQQYRSDIWTVEGLGR